MFDEKIINLSTIRILYVEDDLETREELQSVLEHFVAELYTANNGREGLLSYREHLPDIVITDIQMPEANGLSMAADIKAINPGQPIVILSAYNDVEYLFRALELGIQHYVTKPISVERLLHKLSEITEQLNLAYEAEKTRKLLIQYKLLVDEKAIVEKVDRNGHIVYVNRHFCELSGYSEADVLGQHYLFNFEKTVQKTLLDDLKKTVCEKKKWQGILKQTTKAGDIYVVDVTVVPIVNAEDEIEEFVALMVDNTETIKKFERLSNNLKQNLIQQKHYLREPEIDPLTNLTNRKLFFQRLTDTLASAKRFYYTVALLYIDLDGFKQVNDCLGHSEGDKVLVEAAYRLSSCVREVDTTARFGGDEFVIILNGTSKEMIADTAQRIIDSVSFKVKEKGIELQVSASVGIAIYPDDTTDAMTLLKYADAAMYSAKFKGKSQYCWHVD